MAPDVPKGMSITTLPPEILQDIFQRLCWEHRLSLAFSCQRLRDAAFSLVLLGRMTWPPGLIEEMSLTFRGIKPTWSSSEQHALMEKIESFDLEPRKWCRCCRQFRDCQRDNFSIWEQAIRDELPMEMWSRLIYEAPPPSMSFERQWEHRFRSLLILPSVAPFPMVPNQAKDWTPGPEWWLEVRRGWHCILRWVRDTQHRLCPACWAAGTWARLVSRNDGTYEVSHPGADGRFDAALPERGLFRWGSGPFNLFKSSVQAREAAIPSCLARRRWNIDQGIWTDLPNAES